MAQPQSALRQIPTQSAEPFVRSYNPFNPAFRDTVRSGINELIGGREMGGTPTQRYRAGMADLLTGAVDFAPGVGEAVGVADTVQAARGGNYGTAAMLGGATALGMVPVVGDAASKAVREGIQEATNTPRNTKWLHGTDADFQEFDMAFAGKNFNDASSKEGVFLSAQRGNAKMYGDNIMEVQDTFKNPKIVNAEQDLRDDYLYLTKRGEVSGSFDDFINDFLEGDPYGYYETGKLYADIKSAKSAGHDALIVDFGNLKMDRGGQFAVAFDPSTIKTTTNPLEGTLDMSQAARMQRAAEQGYLPEVVYHGTGNDFDAFDPGMSEGARFNTGVFMTASPDVASTYALGEQRQVLPLMYRAENPINVYAQGANWNRLGPNTRVDLPARTVNQSEDADILRALGVQTEDTQEMLPRTTTLKQLFPEVYGYEDDFMDTNDFSRWAKRQGVDAVVFNDIVDRGPSGTFSNKKALMPARNIVSFDPSNIRSVNAAFDPAKRNSRNLMAGAAGATIGLSALRNIQRDEEPQPD